MKNSLICFDISELTAFSATPPLSCPQRVKLMRKPCSPPFGTWESSITQTLSLISDRLSKSYPKTIRSGRARCLSLFSHKPGKVVPGRLPFCSQKVSLCEQ